MTAIPLFGARGRDRPLRVLLGSGDARPVAGGFRFGGREYRGTFSRGTDGTIINVVALQEYLYSVVPREMSSAWPQSALQMQAICARTFVLRHADAQRPYDVVPSDLNQVYEGVSTESAVGRAAVDATAGKVLRYGDALAQVAYSTCCGGHTESAAAAWGGRPVPYLAGVPCPYCTASPDYRWSRNVPLGIIERAMAAKLRGLGRLRNVRFGRWDASGRAGTVELVASSGDAVVRGSDFRIDVGPALVRSLLILRAFVRPSRVWQTQESLQLDGAGNGHGVGLCQWGARGIAISSGSVAQIASFYFPGTAIDTWTNVSPPLTNTIFRER